MMPAPTTVPTNAVDNNAIGVDRLPIALIRVGTKFTAITTAMIEPMNPVTYPFTSAILILCENGNKKEDIRFLDDIMKIYID